MNPVPATWILLGALASAQRLPAATAPPAAETTTAAPTDAAAGTPPADGTTTPPADGTTTPPADDATTPPATAPSTDEANAGDDASAQSTSAVSEPTTTTPPRAVPPPRAVAPSAAEPAPMQPRARVAFIVMGTVVLAGAGVALGYMGHFIAESSRIEREGRDRVGADPSQTDAASLQGLARDGVRANRTAIGLGIGGALLASSAIAMILTGARKPRTRGVTASVGRGGAGLSWSGKF
ncbi:MAG: hypothetical protein IPH07_13420 [Deltaproteobacteria bacterium]|nr:hypothetical protein [Deltaproteobacteria bacterium]MBK8716922.1 hypothetical protein [Deltaproteobacteria bacterium]MBP7287026.1 hypothetical protein [Nannocystaceae bacterium]